jgi:hypothetical protein
VKDEKLTEGYCIKWCLTQGIFRTDAKGFEAYGRARYARVIGCADLLIVGREWFASKEEAGAAAREMAANKIRSLEKIIEKMRTLAEAPKWRKQEP